MRSKSVRLVSRLLGPSLLASTPVLAQEVTQRRQPCFTGSIEDATAVAVTRDGEAAGVAGLESLFVYRGGLAPMGFVRWGSRPVQMAPHPRLPWLAVSPGNVHIVDLTTKKTVAELKPAVWWVAWRRDGAQVLGIDWDWRVHVWDVATRKKVGKWKLPLEKKVDSRFEDYNAAAGILALAFKDGTIRVFEDETGSELSKFMAHPVSGEDYITGMAFDPEGKRLATCDYGQVKVWDVASGELKRRFTTRSNPGGLARLVRFYAKGTRLAIANAVGGGYGFDFFDAETGKKLAGARLMAHESIVSWDMAFPDSEDPQIVALADTTLYWCRYSAATGQKPGILIRGGERR